MIFEHRIWPDQPVNVSLPDDFGLDVITQAQVWELLLRELDRRSIGLLAITHSESLGKRVCSRVVEFSDINHAKA